MWRVCYETTFSGFLLLDYYASIDILDNGIPPLAVYTSSGKHGALPETDDALNFFILRSIS